jgi:hypothetical protein
MIVLPMAGRSRRFAEAGYKKPKFMLEAHGHSLLEHVVSGFHSVFGKEDFLFVALEEDGVEGFVRDCCSRLGLATGDFQVANLKRPTEGQAQTIFEGLEAASVPQDTPLTIFNIDTIRPDFRYPEAFSLEDVDGYLEVFRAEGDGWSFVEPAKDGGPYDVSRVTEKLRISDLCSTGLYYFRAAELFLDAYRAVAAIPAAELQGGERYVAPLYNRLLQNGCRIKYSEVSAEDIIPCGVPDEYQAFLARRNNGNGSWLAGNRRPGF